MIVDLFAGGGGASLAIQWATGRSPDLAVNHDPAAIRVARIRELGIVDIGMRMLQPRELARAQGFPDSYILTGTQREQVGRIGNSVSPYPAAAVLRANLQPALEAAA